MVKYFTCAVLALAGALLGILCFRVPPTLRALEYDALSRAAAEQAVVGAAQQVKLEIAQLCAKVPGIVTDAVQRSDRRLADAVARSDRRLGETLAEARAARVGLEQRADVALRALGVVGDHAVAAVDGIPPVLAASEALAKQADRSVMIMTPFATGLLGAAKVTAGETAQAAKRIDGEMPRLLLNLDQLTKHAAGITADTHTFTTRFLAPKTTRQKVWAVLELGAKTVGRIL